MDSEGESWYYEQLADWEPTSNAFAKVKSIRLMRRARDGRYGDVWYAGYRQLLWEQPDIGAKGNVRSVAVSNRDGFRTILVSIEHVGVSRLIVNYPVDAFWGPSPHDRSVALL
jgi:hypothetical protein